MRHKIAGKRLNKSSKHRKALFRNLSRELLLRGSITTTQAKAKAVRPFVEKILTKAKKQSLQSRRLIHQSLPDRKLTNYIVDVVAPALKERPGGYTRIRRQGVRRGDGAMLVRLSLVDQPSNQTTPSKESKTK